MENFKIIVLERDNDNIKKIIEDDNLLKLHKSSFVILKNIEKIKLSASYVRELIKKGQSIRGLVPEKIEDEVIRIFR